MATGLIMMNRRLSTIDRFILQADRALKTLIPQSVQSTRPNPVDGLDETLLSDEQKRHIAGLMRINHTGEVCAQGLYQGQAMTADHPHLAAALEKAAEEELDHLAWCEQRVQQLGYTTSLLNPLWYLGSVGIGVVAGLAGDAISLGFVAETEHQVQAHLEHHLSQLPVDDHRTRAIVEQMNLDERQHAEMALAAGGKPLPPPIKGAMHLMSRVMTTLVYYF